MASPSPPTQVRIGIVMGHDVQADREILEGIATYAAAVDNWRFVFQEWAMGPEDRFPDCDAFIIRYRDHPLLSQGVLPRTVAICGKGMPQLRRVWIDDDAVGALAAQHLVEAGVHHLCFPGDPRIHSLRLRRQAFAATGRRLGATVHACDPSPDQLACWTMERERVDMLAALESMPRPVGIACYDAKSAARMMQILASAGMAVPDEVLLFSCIDDEVFCGMSHPRLSAARISHRRLGYVAAELLHAVIDKRAPAERVVLLPPEGVVARGSTCRDGVTSDGLAAALRWMQQHLAESMDVDRVAAAAGESRRSLERRFRAELGRSPCDEWRRRRLMEAQRLLAQPDLSIADVARRCGFRSHAHFCLAFRTAYGAAPSAWRARAGRS